MNGDDVTMSDELRERRDSLLDVQGPCKWCSDTITPRTAKEHVRTRHADVYAQVAPIIDGMVEALTMVDDG